MSLGLQGAGSSLIGTRNVKELVGEVDFSFHIVSTAASSSETLQGSLESKGKQD